jgi:hypothetical protein
MGVGHVPVFSSLVVIMLSYVFIHLYLRLHILPSSYGYVAAIRSGVPDFKTVFLSIPFCAFPFVRVRCGYRRKYGNFGNVVSCVIFTCSSHLN